MRKISRGNMLLLITAILFYGLSLALSLADYIPYPMLAEIFAQLLLMIPALVYCAASKTSVPDAVRIKKTKPVNFLMAFLVILCSYPVSAVLNLVSMFFVENVVSDTISMMLTRYGFWLPFFVVAVMPGICEEFLFRGVVYGSYKKSHPMAGLWISAAVFGLMHGNFNQMPYAMFLGIVFVLMLEATDSILTTMFMHFLLNGSNVLLMYAVGPEMYAAGENSSASVRQMFGSMMLENGAVMVIGVLFIYGMMAILFAAAVFFLIYLTFILNHRSLKQTFMQQSGGEKQHIFDFWLLGFVILMIVVMIFFK